MNDIKLSRKNPKPHIRVQWHVWYEHQDDLFTMMLINWSRSVSLENLTWGPRTRYTNQRRPPPPPSDGLPPQRPSDFLPPLKLRLWEFSSDLQRWRSSYSIVLPIMPLLSFSSALADILPLREKTDPERPLCSYTVEEWDMYSVKAYSSWPAIFLYESRRRRHEQNEWYWNCEDDSQGWGLTFL